MARHKVRRFTQLKRFAGCGAWLNGSANGQVLVKKTPEGRGFFSGLQSCGSVWACPVCAAKIRQARADELEGANAAWLAAGHGIEMITLTIPHRRRFDAEGVPVDLPLEESFDRVAEAWRSGVLAGEEWAGAWRTGRDDVRPDWAERAPMRMVEDKRRAAVELRAVFAVAGVEAPAIQRPAWFRPGQVQRFGISAWVRTIEVTYGQHGWHPHMHVLLYTDKPWTPRQRAIRGRAIFHRWAAYVEATGGGRCSLSAFKIVGGGQGAARYLLKLQEGSKWSLAMEMSRADIKTGKAGSVMPFQFVGPASDGEAWALHRWWEWEQVTSGRRCMTWSGGGRRVVGLLEDEPTDQELAEAEVEGIEVCAIDGQLWAQLLRSPGADSAILDAVERDGAPGVGRIVADVLRGPPV